MPPPSPKGGKPEPGTEPVPACRAFLIKPPKGLQHRGQLGVGGGVLLVHTDAAWKRRKRPPAYKTEEGAPPPAPTASQPK